MIARVRYSGVRICGVLCDVSVEADIKEAIGPGEARDIADALALLADGKLGAPEGTEVSSEKA